MEKVIKVNEGFTITGMFDEMKKGDFFMVEFDQKRHTGIKMEAYRRNDKARYMKKVKYKKDLVFRVSKTEKPGFTSIIKVK